MNDFPHLNYTVINYSNIIVKIINKLPRSSWSNPDLPTPQGGKAAVATGDVTLTSIRHPADTAPSESYRASSQQDSYNRNSSQDSYRNSSQDSYRHSQDSYRAASPLSNGVEDDSDGWDDSSKAYGERGTSETRGEMTANTTFPYYTHISLHKQPNLP